MFKTRTPDGRYTCYHILYEYDDSNDSPTLCPSPNSRSLNQDIDKQSTKLKGEFYIAVEVGGDIMMSIRKYLYKTFSVYLYPDLPVYKDDGSDFNWTETMAFFHLNKIKIPKNAFSDGPIDIYVTIYDQWILEHCPLTDISQLLCLDFMEADICRGCRLHISKGYTGISEHCCENGCLNMIKT